MTPGTLGKMDQKRRLRVLELSAMMTCVISLLGYKPSCGGSEGAKAYQKPVKPKVLIITPIGDLSVGRLSREARVLTASIGLDVLRCCRDDVT